MPSRSAGLTVVFAGGGTGGHLYPAIAIADALRLSGNSHAAFVGTADRLEATIVPQAGYRLHTVASRPLSRRLSPELVRTVAANAAGVVQSLRLLAQLRPDVVIATGGYVCFPFVLATRILRVLRLTRAPIALLEPNARPGLTNRMLAPLVDEVWGAFAEPDPRFAGKYVPAGVPVRAAVRNLPSRAAAVARLGLDPNRKTLLVMGGSQGARTINDAVVALIEGEGLPAGWQLLLVTGEREHARVRAALGRADGAVLAYLDDVATGYAAADLVLARSGASTLAELAAVGRPAILVPYPHAAENHQALNAQRFARRGSAVVVADGELAGALGGLLRDVAAEPRLETLQRAAEGLRGEDALSTVLARVERLTRRKDER
jgi:UDP-N-acetylglucosamine--N-acetylmuramyl-(pentapeptide) pyrophosphoryl-undecaprenol N-acetylglucosamine transferase